MYVRVSRKSWSSLPIFRYEPYFLTVHDIVKFARGERILCQGRGSAANSLVCYCLGVSAVGPERGAALLFERFISRERNEPPDIDIDFEHDRREEVSSTSTRNTDVSGRLLRQRSSCIVPAAHCATWPRRSAWTPPAVCASRSHAVVGRRRNASREDPRGRV